MFRVYIFWGVFLAISFLPALSDITEKCRYWNELDRYNKAARYGLRVQDAPYLALFFPVAPEPKPPSYMPDWSYRLFMWCGLTCGILVQFFI